MLEGFVLLRLGCVIGLIEDYNKTSCIAFYCDAAC